MQWNFEPGYQFQPDLSTPVIRGKRVAVIGDVTELSLATAATLAGNGAPVFLSARSAAELSQALAVVAQVGGEADGMAVDFCQPNDVQRFFDQAEYWLGGLDAVVNYLAMSADPQPVGAQASCQNEAMREAISRMSQAASGQIINVGSLTAETHSPARNKRGAAQNTTVMLRRLAADMGIRVTLIHLNASAGRNPQDELTQICSEDIARCILDSLAQPFGVDVIFLKGQIQPAA